MRHCICACTQNEFISQAYQQTFMSKPRVSICIAVTNRHTLPHGVYSNFIFHSQNVSIITAFQHRFPWHRVCRKPTEILEQIELIVPNGLCSSPIGRKFSIQHFKILNFSLKIETSTSHLQENYLKGSVHTIRNLLIVPLVPHLANFVSSYQ